MEARALTSHFRKEKKSRIETRNRVLEQLTKERRANYRALKFLGSDDAYLYTESPER